MLRVLRPKIARMLQWSGIGQRLKPLVSMPPTVVVTIPPETRRPAVSSLALLSVCLLLSLGLSPAVIETATRRSFPLAAEELAVNVNRTAELEGTDLRILSGDSTLPIGHWNPVLDSHLTQRILSGQTWTFAYGLEGKLTATSGPSFTATYAYDGLGRRVKSVVNGATNVYVYSGLSVLYETNPTTKYVVANGMRLAKIGATTEYYHYDHLGNVRLATDGTKGTVVSTLAYKPFGLAVVVFGPEPKYGYTGAYRESTPNLIYLPSRWYDPTIGRFLSPDDRLCKQSMPP